MHRRMLVHAHRFLVADAQLYYYLLQEGNERSTGLEAALSQTKEERDALQVSDEVNRSQRIVYVPAGAPPRWDLIM